MVGAVPYAMPHLVALEVRQPTSPLGNLARYAVREDWRRLRQATDLARAALAGATLWSVNSTATGGGVAELTRALVPYVRGAGIDARWLVLAGTPEFFEITKRVHNMLHGHPGDRGPLGSRERATYEGILTANEQSLRQRIRAGDVVVVHDPQTAGLVPRLADIGATVIWRCHVGTDHAGSIAQMAWDFLVPFLRHADRIVVSPTAVLPPPLAGIPTNCIAPAIDPCSVKNRGMSDATARAILARAGIVRPDSVTVEPAFRRRDGTLARVRRHATTSQVGAGPRLGRGPLIVHLGRWDRLKDPVGAMEAIIYHVPARLGAHLVLAGPNADAVTDDPEAGRSCTS